MKFTLYTESLTSYERRKTIEVKIGDTPMGATHPIRVQSMTTIDTMDTEGSIEQSIRMIESGCEYVRITAPSIKDAKNLENIKKGLVQRGYHTPLVADIHFTPSAAMEAAKVIEKVRINPGNYVDKKKFDIIEYDDESYQEELARIKTKFTPLVLLCKEKGTAMRIGTNHGSLSDRIMSRYGDTPNGMVESALEFLRICEELEYYDIVISMKSSNPQVMVQAYRLLVARLNEENFKAYPLHLGVTEAGEGEDGRIKSALGIGTLLEDGLGDTVRVSLTEDPELEAPVAKTLIERYDNRTSHAQIPPIDKVLKNPYEYSRRKTHEVLNIGEENVPRVIADFSNISELNTSSFKSIGHYYIPLTDKWGMTDLGADYVYTGNQQLDFMLPNGLKQLVNASVWNHVDNYPLFTKEEYINATKKHLKANFVRITLLDLSQDFLNVLQNDKSIVLILDTDNEHAMAEMRRAFYELLANEITTPVILLRKYPVLSDDKMQLYPATDCGGLLIDGFGDGISLSTELLPKLPIEEETTLLKNYNSIAFGVLQAARTRMTKTEYISCPSCGRTLFDLQETTALIRKRTDHLKGVKIGIMGCIVNGPGEMADADYGYVGSGIGKITLYKGQEVVKRAVPSVKAVDELINIIKEDGKWIEPVLNQEV